MFLLLHELRSIIRQGLLIETRVVADESQGASRYRVFSLSSADGNNVGKIVIVPTDMDTVDVGSLLKNKGFQPERPKGIDAPYGEERTPEQEEQLQKWTNSYHHASQPILVDVEKQTIDLGDAIKFNNYKDRRPGAKGNKNRSYVIPHGGVVGDNTLTLQKILKALMKHDVRVKADFQIVGNPKYEDKTIEGVLTTPDVGAAVAQGRGEPITFYHGTSAKRLEAIKQNGLRPGNAPFVYVDLVKNYSEYNVYLTTSVDVAENYATRAAVDDKSKAVVLKVVVRDLTRLIFDEDGANWLVITSPGPPWTKNSQKGEKINIHFRHEYAIPWQEWPNANEIWSSYQQKLIKNLRKAHTVAYKGSISKADISVYETYKPASMKGDPDDAEFDAARADTFASLKKEPSSVDKPIASKSKQVEKPKSNDGQKSYKIYGRKGSSPAHTRLKGKAYVARQGTRFKAGDAAHVAPIDGKLKVSAIDSDHSQIWEPEE